jgi:hypothetical protein
MRTNIRVFILVALFAAVLLQAGTADATIIVKNATSIWNTTSEIMPEDITASPRIIAEYPNSIFSSDLEDTPESITAFPRIITEYPNSISRFDLDTPGNINASPRIIAEYSNSISRFDLDTPGNITASPRLIAKQSNSIWRTNFAFPIELFNDTEPPVITNVTTTNITDKSATIKWDTDEIANSLVKYGEVSGIYTESEEDTSRIKNHTIKLIGLLPGTCYYFIVNSTDRSGNSAESSEFNFNTSGVPTPTPPPVFDTEAPANQYPSISGTHNGTITPTKKIEVSTLYTYPCTGTGGHTEYARIWNSTLNVTAKWEGYTEDWHNISFDEPFTLIANKEYNYTIRTGSYPQIHHMATSSTANGWINCTEFLDANGLVYTDWIPAIRLWA